MKLRPRLALSILLTAVPLTAIIAWARADIERSANEQAFREFVLAKMDADCRERCETSPETFRDPPEGGPGGRRGGGPRPFGGGFDSMPRHKPMPRHGGPPPGPPPGGPGFGPPSRIEIYAYDAGFVSANPRAPAFPPEIQATLAGGAEYAASESELDGKPVMQLGARMPWQEGPCAIVLARRFQSTPNRFHWEILGTAFTLTCALLFAVLLAVGPIVRRIVRLTGDVRRAAEDGYATPIELRGKDEVSQLARAFNDAGSEVRGHIRKLEEREETLRSFVANTTHDVMLPLTVLNGHLTSLRNRMGADGEPATREIVADSLEEAHYMASLIQNLGARVKLESGEQQIGRHPVNLNQVVERVIGRHKPIARERDVNLDFTVPEPHVWVEGDVTLLEQAVSNVTHNAVRYNEPGGHVTLILDLDLNGGDSRCFSLRVVDDGPGVSDELLMKLAERSFRTDEARRRHPEGLGLGLHIAASVMRVHGFTLELRRSSPGGLEVEFRGRESSAPEES